MCMCSQHDTNAFIISGDQYTDVQLIDDDDAPDALHGDGHGCGDGGGEEPQGEEKSGKKRSKSQQRKLKKIEEERVMRLKRQKILEKLSQYQIGSDELSMLRSASSRGQQETKKEILKRALMMERAGIELPSDLKDVLYSSGERKNDYQKNVNELPTEDGSSDSEHQEEEEEEEVEETQDHVHQKAAEPPYHEGVDVPDRSIHHCIDDMDDHNSAVQEEALKRAREEIRKAHEEQESHGNDSDSDIADQTGNQTIPLSNVVRKVIMVERTAEIEAIRSSLPIVGMEQEIMESISENDVVVLCGETGCGKTTQLPQFLYEGGYTFIENNKGIIGVTQPRRVAAVSTAHRVSEELGSTLGGVVGYHVRYDRRVSVKTKVQFMTDGILLRELQDDFLLKKYNVIIVDEAHERSLNTDVLLGMLSRVVKLRRQLFGEYKDGINKVANVLPLKLVIMSATLRIGDFVDNKRLFQVPPPVINIQARQYPVAVHFQKKTELDDYVGAAYKKACQIHKQLPDGGILVFLTGQREVETLCSKLRQTFNKDEKARKRVSDCSTSYTPDILDGLDESEMQWDGEDDIGFEGDDDFDDDSDDHGEEEEKVEIMNGGEEDLNETLKLENVPEGEPLKKVWVLPLYAMLRPDQQARVFKPVPQGHRLIVVATNIAETSLTIPGIRYVVDAGRSKQRLLESSSGLAKYDVRWISKASADQRAGRSGRMGPGHCYRIYSSAVFNDMFPQFSPPEIYNIALEGVVLLLKSIGVDNVTNFPFPSPPDPSSLVAAERCLINLSAINKGDGSLTSIGKSMAKLPIEPRHARLLLEVLMNRDNSQNDETLVNTLVMFAIRLTAAMSLESPFINPSSLQDHRNVKEDGVEDTAEKEIRKQNAAKLYSAHAKLRLPGSDHLSAMNALCAYEDNGASSLFCKENFLIFKHLREGLQLTKQLERILHCSELEHIGVVKLDLSGLKKPKTSPKIVIALKRAILAGWGDHVSKRVRSVEYLAKKKAEGSKTRAVRYESISIDEDVFLHPSSSLFSSSPSWVIYSDIIRTDKRAYMVGITTIEPQWIHSAVPQLTQISKPLSKPVPKYSLEKDCVMAWHDATYGPLQWEIPPVLLPHPDTTERAAIFAMNILDGTVVPKMKAYTKFLVASPSIIGSSEMRVHRRIFELIQALDSHHVYSKSDLCLAWKSDPLFLRKEISAWVKKQYLSAFLKEWKNTLATIYERR